MFLLSLIGQLVSGLHEYNDTQRRTRPAGRCTVGLCHHRPSLRGVVRGTGRARFLQMAVFVLLTTFLIQKRVAGIAPTWRARGRRRGSTGFRRRPAGQWPVRRGGWVLRLYENSLGLAFVLLFLGSWVGRGRRVRGVCGRSDLARPGASAVDGVSDIAAVLVRVVPELAGRVSRLVAGRRSPPSLRQRFA